MTALHQLRATIALILDSYDHIDLSLKRERAWLAARLAAELCDDFEVREADEVAVLQEPEIAELELGGEG